MKSVSFIQWSHSSHQCTLSSGKLLMNNSRLKWKEIEKGREGGREFDCLRKMI